MEIRSAILADVPAILSLQAQVVAGLEHSALFSTDNALFYQKIVADQGHVALACVAGQIIGCSVLRYPTADDAENLAADAGLPLALWGQVAHLEAAYLLPQYRGRGLAHSLSRHNMDMAVAQGRLHILATAWPCNVPSLKNLFSLNFQVRGLAHKYGGKLRCILLHTAGPPAHLDGIGTGGPTHCVALDNEQGHRRALMQGLQGSRLLQRGTTFVMLYTRILT